MYAALSTWFIKRSGHKGFAKVPIPEQCPRPVIITDKDTTNNVNEDEPRKTEELQAHEFDWHTLDGLLEGIVHCYDNAVYAKEHASEQTDMLVKRYSVRQLKHVIVLSSANTLSLKGLNLHCIT